MKLDRLNIGIIGATGAVGTQALKLLASADERLETLEKYFSNTKEVL